MLSKKNPDRVLFSFAYSYCVEVDVQKVRIYVGCGLTWAIPVLPEPPEFCRFKENVALLKRDLGGRYEVLDFIGLGGGRSEEECQAVYVHDIKRCVGTTEILLAICDWPAIGLGWELGTAVEAREIPTLAVARQGCNVSRLVLGATHNRRFYFREYDDMVRDVPVLLEEMVRYAGVR